MTMLFVPVYGHLVYKNIDSYSIMVSSTIAWCPFYSICSCHPGRAVGQEWRLFDVGGTRSSVSQTFWKYVCKDLFLFLRGQLGILISTIVSVLQHLPLPVIDLVYNLVDAIIFLAWVRNDIWRIRLYPLILWRFFAYNTVHVGIDNPIFWLSRPWHLNLAVSPFDEKLAEDRHVNRLEDSYLLWKSVCSCKLLARTQVILCKSIPRSSHALVVRPYIVPSSSPKQMWPTPSKAATWSSDTRFGAQLRRSQKRPSHRHQMQVYFQQLQLLLANFLSHHVDFQQHFKEILKQHSPVPRSFYMYLTSVIVSLSPVWYYFFCCLPPSLVPSRALWCLLANVPLQDTKSTAVTLGAGIRVHFSPNFMRSTFVHSWRVHTKRTSTTSGSTVILFPSTPCKSISTDAACPSF